jgi:hypothetical protein
MSYNTNKRSTTKASKYQLLASKNLNDMSGCDDKTTGTSSQQNCKSNKSNSG